MVNIPDRSATAGLASQYSENITAVDIALITGDSPAYLTVDHLVEASQNIPAYTPVQLVNGRIVPAVAGTPAIGITLTAIVTSASTTYKAAPILRGACLNPDKLNWPASFDTEPEKFNAFNGADSPTNIVVRRPKTATVS